jgi:hypothetical protein
VAKRHPDEPTLDEYMSAAITLATLVRKAFDNPKSVPRDRLLQALKRFEKLDYRAL